MKILAKKRSPVKKRIFLRQKYLREMHLKSVAVKKDSCYLFIKYRQLFNGRCDKILVSIHTVLMNKQGSIFSLYVLILF